MVHRQRLVDCPTHINSNRYQDFAFCGPDFFGSALEGLHIEVVDEDCRNGSHITWKANS